MKYFPRSALLVRATASKRTTVCLSCMPNFSNRRSLATQSTRRDNPEPPPQTGYVHLPDRRLIAIAGANAPKFLHGLITASIYKPGSPSTEQPRTDGFYTAFLTAQGRVLHDTFIHPNPQFHGLSDATTKGLLPEQSFLIEVDDSQLNALFTLIRRYKLRSAVTHNKLDQEEFPVYSYWNETFSAATGVPEELSSYNDVKRAYITPDLRSPDLGWRVITNGKTEFKVDAKECKRSTYTVRRYLRGVAEGPDEITPDKTLPLDANIDLMGGIDFRKGCYVGQELTIRTKHRGVVRKRILPCVIYEDGESIPQELAYSPTPDGRLGAADVPAKTAIEPAGSSNRRRTGNWIGGVGNVGLAMCRLQPMTDIELPGESTDAPYDPQKEFTFKWDTSTEGGDIKGLKIKPFVPDWMRQRLAQNVPHGRQVLS